MAVGVMVTKKTLLIGVFSVFGDADRRAAIRETWATGLDSSGAPGSAGSVLSVAFVLGWPKTGLTDHVLARIAAENATHGDIALLPCVENLHQGKTPHWFKYASANMRTADGREFNYIAKGDQDVYIWAAELATHVQAFADHRFYGGVPVDVHRRLWKTDRFRFTNGGLAILSQDLVKVVADIAADALAHPLTTGDGLLEAALGPDQKGNEDVILGRFFKHLWVDGSLVLNSPAPGSDYPWSQQSADATAVDVWTTKILTDRQCAWRHSKDLKTAGGMREFASSRAARPFQSRDTCRCNCPWADSYEEEAKLMTKQRNRSKRRSTTPAHEL